MHPGRIIKMLRTAEDLSQINLAKKLDISRSYLSLVENEKKTPALPVIQRIAKLFDIPAALLFIEPDRNDSDLEIDLQRILGDVLAAKIHLAMGK
jgi:transcriptional regulator with XRE-family HTH domain